MRKIIPISAIFLFIICSPEMIGQPSLINEPGTAGDIIQLIIKKTGSDILPNTVDVIKEGDPSTQVTGIITTMFATMEVLREAVNRNCNLIIVHEPLYYNHTDATTQFQNDAVFLEKQKYIRDNKLVIWRFHDYIHRIQPDGILSGMVVKLGWQQYVVDGHLQQFKLPETTLEGLLKMLKQKFQKNGFYVVGDPQLKLTNVRLAPGAPGSSSHIRALENEDVDVVIAGESPQWETYEYMRDAVSQGRKKAIVFIGHISSEEAGMDFCANWLKDFINLPVTFIESGPSYWTY